MKQYIHVVFHNHTVSLGKAGPGPAVSQGALANNGVFLCTLALSFFYCGPICKWWSLLLKLAE